MLGLIVDSILKCHNFNNICVDNYAALLYILLNCATGCY